VVDGVIGRRARVDGAVAAAAADGEVVVVVAALVVAAGGSERARKPGTQGITSIGGSKCFI
jgi:hypothetical protein